MNDRRAQAPEKQHPPSGSVGPEPGSSVSLGLDSQGQVRVGWLGTVRPPALRGNSWGPGWGLHGATVGPLTAADTSSQNERSAWPTVSVRHFSPVGNHFSAQPGQWGVRGEAKWTLFQTGFTFPPTAFAQQHKDRPARDPHCICQGERRSGPHNEPAGPDSPR